GLHGEEACKSLRKAIGGKNMKVLFLDLETTGLNPEKEPPSFHIWQIAWVKGIEDGKTLRLVEGREKLLLPISKT
ncbi:MAG: hypothetical protein QXE28_05020, partial [Desulfurococcaceae archaeon]